MVNKDCRVRLLRASWGERVLAEGLSFDDAVGYALRFAETFFSSDDYGLLIIGSGADDVCRDVCIFVDG